MGWGGGKQQQGVGGNRQYTGRDNIAEQFRTTEILAWASGITYFLDRSVFSGGRWRLLGQAGFGIAQIAPVFSLEVIMLLTIIKAITLIHDKGPMYIKVSQLEAKMNSSCPENNYKK